MVSATSFLKRGEGVARIAGGRANRRHAAPAKRSERTHDAETTREEILEAATEEFADKGLSGARIDKIAERTSTSKRMI